MSEASSDVTNDEASSDKLADDTAENTTAKTAKAEWQSEREVPERFQDINYTPSYTPANHALSGQQFGEASQEGNILVEASEADILEAMRDVIDPELGINIVDLGLVYGVQINEYSIVLDMTLTSAACPLTDMIEEQTRMVLSVYSDAVIINWVWLPPWGPDKITAEGREQLQALGFNI